MLYSLVDMMTCHFAGMYGSSNPARPGSVFCLSEGVVMTSAFATLGLCPELAQTVTALGYTQPTPIQTRAIPELLAGRDVLGQAQTGTGKTAAFALPMLQLLDMQGTGVQGLVLVPTRELAIQVAEAIYRYRHHLGSRVLPIYGGPGYSRPPDSP